VNRRLALGSIAVIVLSLIACSSVVLVASDLADPLGARALAAAEARWRARPFQHYQMTVDVGGDLAFCTQTVEVHGGTVMTVLADSCMASMPTPPQSVDQIFETLRPYTQEFVCGPNGCGCDWMKLEAAYDKTLGYPLRAQVRQVDPTWWQHYLLWPDASGFCTLMGARGPGFEIHSITPLP